MRPTVEEFLQDFPEPVREVVDRLRTIVHTSIPGLSEAVYPGWRLIGYRVLNGKRSHYFLYIAPDEDKVTLGFEYGSMLRDAPEFLKGENLKQVRYVEIQQHNDIQETTIRELVLQAALVAISRQDHKHAR